MDQLLKTLIEIGLKAKEADVYLTLLTIGCNPVSIVAKKARQNRSNCYTIIEKLIEKGFVQQVIKNNINYYCAIDPKSVINQLKTKHYELEAQINSLNESLQCFNDLKNPYEQKPKVIFYQGEAGIKNIMEDTLSAKEPLRAYASLDELTALLPNYFPQYYQRRKEKGLCVKAIYPATKQSLEHKQRDKEELRESRLIPKEFDFHLDIIIYDQKIAVTSLKEKFGILIESKDMAEAKKNIFDLIWKATKIYDQAMTKIIEKQKRLSLKPSLFS